MHRPDPGLTPKVALEKPVFPGKLNRGLLLSCRSGAACLSRVKRFEPKKNAAPRSRLNLLAWAGQGLPMRQAASLNEPWFGKDRNPTSRLSARPDEGFFAAMIAFGRRIAR
jgi:hypothetical protein